jgi:hypothetical protein
MERQCPRQLASLLVNVPGFGFQYGLSAGIFVFIRLLDSREAENQARCVGMAEEARAVGVPRGRKSDHVGLIP